MQSANIKKKESLASLKKIFSRCSFIAVYQQNGLDSNESILLQQYCKQNNLKLKSIKNTSVKVALKESKYKYFSHLFEGPCIIVYCECSTSDVLFSVHKKFSKLIPLGAIYQNSYVLSDKFEWISTIKDFRSVYNSIADLCCYSGIQVDSSLNCVNKSLDHAISNIKS